MSDPVAIPGPLRAWLEDSSGGRLPIEGTCSLGRSVSNQVALPDERVSRRHAIIQIQQENEYWLVDFGSSNGTHLNGRRIIQPTRLKHGDLLQIGPFRFVFHQSDANEPITHTTAFADQTVADIRLATCWLLVADIVDSSRLARELPADELPLVTGQWVAECKQTIEGSGGRINQFLGDGFFAFWYDRERVEITLTKALLTLRRLQELARPAFRLVLHFGQVAIGGVALGEEERISGSEVHFVFRMEKLATSVGVTRLLSEPAWNRLSALIEAQEAGAHPLHGFNGNFKFYSF
jgi:class 3 adenylate cyclase